MAISRVLSWTIIHLGQMSPSASSNLPGNHAGRMSCQKHVFPYLVLLQVGFTLPLLLPAARCALTAPFHPYPTRESGGILSVALAVDSRPPGVTWHLALWSPDFPHQNKFQCDCLAISGSYFTQSSLFLLKFQRQLISSILTDR